MSEPIIVNAATLEEAHNAILRQFPPSIGVARDENGDILGIDWETAIKGTEA